MATATAPSTDVPSIRQRKAKLQGWVTRMVSEARQALHDGGQQRTQVTGIRNNLQTRYAKYKTACEQLIDVIDDDDELNQLFQEITVFDNEVESLLVQLHYEEHKDKSSGPSATAKVRLPKLQLKNFSGDVLSWPEFLGFV